MITHAHAQIHTGCNDIKDPPDAYSSENRELPWKKINIHEYKCLKLEIRKIHIRQSTWLTVRQRVWKEVKEKTIPFMLFLYCWNVYNLCSCRILYYFKIIKLNVNKLVKIKPIIT